VESAGQQLLQAMRLAVCAGVHQQPRPTVLHEELTAPAAGRERFAVTGCHADRDQVRWPVADELRNEAALGAKCQPVRGVLHIAAGEHPPVGAEPCGPDLEPGIGCVRPGGGRVGSSPERSPVNGWACRTPARRRRPCNAHWLGPGGHLLDTTLLAVTPHVVVAGDVMVDVVVRQLGTFNPGSDTSCQIVLAPGGSAANQAVALAAAGARVWLVGVVGDDEIGAAAARALQASGVGARLRAVLGAQTGVVVSLVASTGERSMYTDRGANLCLQENDFPTELFGPGRHLHLSGYELLDGATRPAARTALARAASAGMTRSVDPCSAGPLLSVGADRFLEWTGGLEWCCANLDEGRVLSGLVQPQDVARRLSDHFKEVVITLGRDGALLSNSEVGLLHCPASAVQVADTTGAGDAFTGTFLARRLAGAPPREALIAGLAAAARVVTTPGARPWA